MRTHDAILVGFATLISGSPLFVAAHSDESQMMAINETETGPTRFHASTIDLHNMPSYFRYQDYTGWNLSHMILMSLAWCIAMPLAIMLSVVRCRYSLLVQVVFHIFNGLGVLTAIVYNYSTPDLYENNAHHRLGWTVVVFALAWTAMSFYLHYSRANPEERQCQDSREYQRFHDETPPRHSNESQQGNEQQMESVDPLDRRDQESETSYFLNHSETENSTLQSRPRSIAQCAAKFLSVSQKTLEKSLLLLGFASLFSGFIVSAGLFRDHHIFSGLAHAIKGGIFLVYGILSLARWIGAFADFGWAWNVRPQRPLVSKWTARVPSAEFVESFVIWLYGASNVFLEHLGHWGGRWEASDFEHLSITILFFGGGLLGMVVESKWIRGLSNRSLDRLKSRESRMRTTDHLNLVSNPAVEEPGEHTHRYEEPTTHHFSLNPMPALTIMLLGMMMGAHHHDSMVSTMLHAQWGGLFSAFAIARGVTYITLYLKPPTSHLPSRPPSEIIASFCLCAGGMVFMASATDIVWAIESNGLDAMTVFMVSMGLTGIVLAWEAILFAIKGWAMNVDIGTRMLERS